MKCYIFNPFTQPSRSIKKELECRKCKKIFPREEFVGKVRNRYCKACVLTVKPRVKKVKPTNLTKTCLKCKQTKPLIDFEVFGARMIRHSKLCKACRDTLVL